MALPLRFRKIFFSVLCGLNAGVFAASTEMPSSIKPSFSPKFLVGLSGGLSWQNAGQTQNIALVANDLPYTYIPNSSTQTLGTGELFLGIQSPLTKKMQVQWGLALASSTNANLSGNIYDSIFNRNTYSYSYQVKHSRVALKGKLLLGELVSNWGFALTPWISASVGLGINQAHSYNSTPLFDTGSPMPNFANNTIGALAYTLGAGIEYSINSSWQVGIGYEFADWGKSQLAAAPGQTAGAAVPSLSHLYTNSVLMNVSYIIN
jgi:opacity protein-like surface antigen